MPRFHRPDPVGWAESSIILPGEVAAARPGPLRLYAWQQEVLRSLCRPGTTVLRVASQSGKTEVIKARIGYQMAVQQAGVVMAMPTLDDVGQFHRGKMMPTVLSSPELRALVHGAHRGGETVGPSNFRWPGGQMRYAHAASGRAMRGATAPCLIFDELDAAQGSLDARNPVDMLRQRGEGYPADEVSVGLSSTPRRGGMIDYYYDEGTAGQWYVRCGSCGERFVWRFEPEYAELGWIPCPGCGRRFGDREAMGMNAAGEWVAAHPDRAVRSYHISQLASPVRAQSETLARYTPASPSGFYTQIMASSYEDVVGSLRVPDEAAVWSAERPWPGQITAAGVDVQGDRIEMQIVEFGEQLTRAWTYCHRVYHYGTAGEDAAWWAMASDAISEGCRIVFIDTGYEPDAVRGQARRVFGSHWQRAVFGAHSAKGSDTLDNPAGFIHANAVSGDVRIGAAQAKSALASMIQSGRYKARPSGVLVDPGSRFDFLTQLQSEQLVASMDGKRLAWEKSGAGVRNEALDCFAYALCAAAYLDTPHYQRRRRRRR